MTVKTVTDAQKNAVALIYRNGTRTIKQMATSLGVSTRTIGRILVEKGEMPPQVKKTKDDEQALSTLRAWKIHPSQLQGLLQQLENAGYINMVDGQAKVTPVVTFNEPTLYKSIYLLADCEFELYESLITKIVGLRAAKQYNTSVQAAMLKLEQQTINAGKVNA